jgi:hypothetical protein
MGLSFGFGFGPFRASTRLGSRGGQGNGGGDLDFWIYVFIVIGLALGVPLALSDVWDFLTYSLLWGWLLLGLLPSCAILLLHAHRLSVVSGGRLSFNSGDTVLLAFPAGGYSFIVLFALADGVGKRWLILLSLVPFGVLHLLWVRWTIWFFSQKRIDEKEKRFADEEAMRDFAEKMSREKIQTVDELRVRLRIEAQEKEKTEIKRKIKEAKRKAKETKLEQELIDNSKPSNVARRQANEILDQLDESVIGYVEAHIKGGTYLDYDFSKQIPRAALESLHVELANMISGARNSLLQIESLELDVREKCLQIIGNVEQYVFEETPISAIWMERKQLNAAEKQTQQAYLGIAISDHIATVLKLIDSRQENASFESDVHRVFVLMRTLLADFSAKWGIKAETKELEVAELAELVFNQTGLKDL